jgi:hypothetical protein
MSRPEIESWPPWWEASTLEKSHSNSLLIDIWNILILARDRYHYVIIYGQRCGSGCALIVADWIHDKA